MSRCEIQMFNVFQCLLAIFSVEVKKYWLLRRKESKLVVSILREYLLYVGVG